MDLAGELRELREWVKVKIEQRLAALFVYTLTATTSALGDGDQVESSDEGTDPGTNTKGQRPTTRMQPFGFNSRAPKGLRAFSIALGSSNLFFIGIAPQQKYGAGVDVGESLLYNLIKGCQTLLDKNGNQKIDSGTPDGGSQGDVIVNGGNAAVGRVGDAVNLGSWAVAVDILGAITSIIWTPPGGGAPVTLSTVAQELDGKIKAGADHFKA